MSRQDAPWGRRRRGSPLARPSPTGGGRFALGGPERRGREEAGREHPPVGHPTAVVMDPPSAQIDGDEPAYARHLVQNASMVGPPASDADNSNTNAPRHIHDEVLLQSHLWPPRPQAGS